MGKKYGIKFKGKSEPSNGNGDEIRGELPGLPTSTGRVQSGGGKSTAIHVNPREASRHYGHQIHVFFISLSPFSLNNFISICFFMENRLKYESLCFSLSLFDFFLVPLSPLSVHLCVS